jgi:chorismate mutase
MDKIVQLRQDIDSIDDKIMKLLDKRFSRTKAIGKEKMTTSKLVLDSKREEYIFNKTSLYSHYPQIKSVYEHIMNLSKLQQEKK